MYIFNARVHITHAAAAVAARARNVTPSADATTVSLRHSRQSDLPSAAAAAALTGMRRRCGAIGNHSGNTRLVTK